VGRINSTQGGGEKCLQGFGWEAWSEDTIGRTRA
jgi:hypothetical protein